MNRSAQCTIRLLGSVDVCYAQQPIRDYESTKALALLCYLVSRNQPVYRQHLMGLLWPDKNEEQARNNLSVVLHNLKTLLPGLLTSDRQTIQLDPTADYWCDTHHIATVLNQSDTRVLAAAVTLYRGDFLEGFFLKGCPEFEVWLAIEREVWRQQMKQVLYHLAQHTYNQQAYVKSQAYTTRLLAIDPLDEAAHRQMMRVLTMLDQRHVALEQYHTCCSTLQEELGIYPDLETTHLYEQIRSGTFVSSPAVDRPTVLLQNLPHQTSLFVGRATDLKRIAELLAAPECRLLNLVGPGGIGKTRLAVEVAYRRIHGCDSACFVDLQGISDPDDIPLAIADALGYLLRGREIAINQLIARLDGQSILLILDNFEHLLTAADLLVQLLSRTTGVRLLATSREVLNLREEWVYPIEGLPFPTTVSEQSEPYAAVQFFNSLARRIQPDFVLTDNLLSVVKICQQVQGMPLALELAATWLRSLSCSDIANAIEQSTTFLTTSLRDIPERHRSMQAVFQHSWQSLSASEQQFLAGTAVFRGGFDRQAAQEVVGATLPDLTALVQKSLLRFDVQQNRYVMHELLRQFATEQLATTDTLHKVYQAHTRYYAHLLREIGHGMRGGTQPLVASMIDTERGNLCVATQWAAAHGMYAELRQMLMPLCLYYHVRNRYVEGQGMLEDVVNRIDANDLSAQETLAYVLVALAWFEMLLGNIDRAEAVSLQSLYLHECFDLPLPLPHLYNIDPALTLSAVHQLRGNFMMAQEYAQTALQRHSTVDTLASNQRMATYLLATSVAAQGDYETALLHAEAACCRAEQAQDDWLLSRCHGELGNIHRALQRCEAAAQHYESSYRLCEIFDDREGMALALSELGGVAMIETNYQEAQHYFTRSIAMYQDIHDRVRLTQVLLGAAQSATALNDLATAQQMCGQALQTAAEMNAAFLLLPALAEVGNLLCHTGHHMQGVQLLHIVATHPACPHEQKSRAQQLLSIMDVPSSVPDLAVIDLIQLAHEAQHWLIEPLSVHGITHSFKESLVDQASVNDLLSQREVELLRVLAHGLPNRDIALRLNISMNTVKTHLGNIYNKLVVRNRTQAINRARDLGLL